jgi:hypothetical protein
MPKELIAGCTAIDLRSPDEAPERSFPGAAAVA